MDKKLQDHVWSILPKEFKEEIKAMYNRHILNDLDFGYKSALLNLFGHNLTSDAEGEEMLTCEKCKVQKLYSYYCTERDNEENGSVNKFSLSARIAMLEDLFGSKCLPDEKLTANVDSSDPNVDSSESKAAGPKFNVGDEVVWDKRIIAYIDEILNDGDYIIYSRVGNRYTVHESDLEPYTEPKDEADKHFDTIIKGGFRNGRRLNIAAMAMQGMLANSNPKMVEIPFDQVPKLALIMADTLLAECEKNK